MDALPPHLTAAFPRLTAGVDAVTSEYSPTYNCIAHAYGVDDRNIDPTPGLGRWWPANVPRGFDVEAFRTLFKGIGYEDCADGAPEEGYDKVAIYASSARVRHAARQLATGEWSSKLGSYEDISHRHLGTLEIAAYGTAVAFLRRRLPSIAAQPSAETQESGQPPAPLLNE